MNMIMKNFKKAKILAIIISLIVLFYGQNQLLADETSPWSTQFYSYRFHLYYDNGQLFADRDFEFKYDLVAEEFAPETLTTQAPYTGEIVNVRNEIKATFQFDPKQGNSKFVKGKISIKGPYFANAAKVNFYNDKNQLLLTLDLSGSSFCNDDGTCNSDVGENYQNCPNDCPRPSPSPAYQPPAPSVWQNMLIPILVAVAIIIAVLVVWVIIKRKRTSAGQNQGLPPETPLTPPIL